MIEIVKVWNLVFRFISNGYDFEFDDELLKYLGLVNCIVFLM